MMLQRYLLPALLAPAMLLATVALAAPLGLRDDGSDVDGEFKGGDQVDGFLRVGRDRFVLNYAYAIEEQRIDGAVRAGERSVPFTVEQSRVVVFLTDLPIPDEALGDIARIHEAVRAFDLRGVELVFDNARRKTTWTGRLLLGQDDANQVFRLRSGGRKFQLEDFDRDGGGISGAILIDRGTPLFDRNGVRTNEKFMFTVEFDLPVDSAPLPTNVIEDTMARATPQAEILLTVIDAIKKNDVEKFRELSGDGSEINFLVQGPNKDAYQAALLNDLPVTEGKLRSSISKIVFFGDRAALVARSTGGILREFTFEREDGQWKLTQG